MSLAVCDQCYITYDTQEGVGLEFRKSNGCPCCELKEQVEDLKNQKEIYADEIKFLEDKVEELEDKVEELNLKENK